MPIYIGLSLYSFIQFNILEFSLSLSLFLTWYHSKVILSRCRLLSCFLSPAILVGSLYRRSHRLTFPTKPCCQWLAKTLLSNKILLSKPYHSEPLNTHKNLQHLIHHQTLTTSHTHHQNPTTSTIYTGSTH